MSNLGLVLVIRTNYVLYKLQIRQEKLVGFSNLSQHSSKEVAKFTVDLLPALCEHLETTSAFFQVRHYLVIIIILLLLSLSILSL